tara:strand:+ start:418 stop:762 length:345 start_codon:yes stop_codon:yes gene_type:complete
MKKVTISVAALLIAMSGFSTNPDSTSVNLPKVHIDGNKNSVHGIDNKDNWSAHQFNTPTNGDLIKQITITTEDIIDWVKEDEYNGRIMTKELASIYVNNLLNILSKVEDLKLKQ